jgi:hypothetical protein
MTSTTHVEVPAGYRAVEAADGAIRVERHPSERLAHTIAVRFTSRAIADLQPFISTFPTGRSSDAVRWLLEQPETKAAMLRRMEQVTRKAKP